MDSGHSQPRASPLCLQVHVGQGKYSSDTSQNCCISACLSAVAALKYLHKSPVKKAHNKSVSN